MSPRGPIEVDPDDLSPETLAKLKGRARNVVNGIQVGEGSPLLAARGAQTARKRQRVGKSLEQELELVHQLYELAGKARLRKTHPATIVRGHDRNGPVLRYAPRGAGVDYAGTARVGGKVRPIAFDLKSWEKATYAHDPKQSHQLVEILERQRFGELAFLLIVAAPLNTAYLVLAEAPLRALARGQELLLRRPVFAGEGSGKRVAGDRDRFAHLVPHFFAPRELLVSPDTLRWDWLSRLETLVTEGK